MEEQMRFRSVKRIDTGQWVNVLFTVDGDEFSVKPTSHRADIAKALGVLRTSLEVVDADADPRTGVLLEMPQPPDPGPTPEELAQDAAATDLVGEMDILFAARLRGLDDMEKARLKERVLGLVGSI